MNPEKACDDCLYSDLYDWDDNGDGTAKAILWCEKHKDMCNDISTCDVGVYEEEENGRTE